jgi:hypothetical protein
MQTTETQTPTGVHIRHFSGSFNYNQPVAQPPVYEATPPAPTHHAAIRPAAQGPVSRSENVNTYMLQCARIIFSMGQYKLRKHIDTLLTAKLRAGQKEAEHAQGVIKEHFDDFQGIREIEMLYAATEWHAMIANREPGLLHPLDEVAHFGYVQAYSILFGYISQNIQEVMEQLIYNRPANLPAGYGKQLDYLSHWYEGFRFLPENEIFNAYLHAMQHAKITDLK